MRRVSRPPILFGLGKGADPYWNSVSLLLRGQGANGQTTFTDLSPFGHAITRTAGTSGPQITTAQARWGDSSIQIEGNTSTAAALLAPAHSSLDLTTGDWTIEMWVRIEYDASAILYTRQVGTSYYAAQVWYDGGSKFIQLRGFTPALSLWTLSDTAAAPIGSWVFIQGRRVGTVVDLAINGAQVATTSVSGALYSSAAQPSVGNFSSGGISTPLRGQFQDLRVTKGVGRNFGLPDAQFPAF